MTAKMKSLPCFICHCKDSPLFTRATSAKSAIRKQSLQFAIEATLESNFNHRCT